MSGHAGNAAVELAVHAAAAAHRADAARLCDSDAFMSRVEQFRPDEPGFVARVSDAVRETVEADDAYRLPQPDDTTAAAPRQRTDEPRQWTDEDVDRSTPAELEAAMKAGLLSDLGVGAPRRKRGARL